MKAAVLTGHGGLDLLQIADLPEPPPPKAHEVRVRMKAVALNRLDLWVREGWPSLKLNMPHIVAADGAGIVEAVGEGVTNLVPGDRVGINPTITDEECLSLTGSEEFCLDGHILGEMVPGVAAEYVNLPVRNLIKLPDHVSFAESAAAGLVYVTAWHSLINCGQLKPGESVLIVGAGGGVNTASIQIAKLCGCTVYVVGSNADKCQQTQQLGADFSLNRADDPAWSKALYKMTNRQGVDVVVDNVGQATISDSMRSVRRGGRILIVGNTSGPMATIDMRLIFGKQIRLIGSTMGPTSAFKAVMAQVFAGKLKPVIGAELPLEEIRRGHELLEAGNLFGKVVLRLD